MGNGGNVPLAVAFFAGFLTFLSPCILLVIPAYISYITGISFDGLKDKQSSVVRRQTLIHAGLFILGFSLIFITLGASASYIGRFLGAHRTIVSRAGGVLVIFFGLYIMGLLRLDFLDKEKRFSVKVRKGSKLGSLLLGITFAAAWTPCVDPILGSLLVIAGTREKVIEGIALLSVYSLGLATPFMASALLTNFFLAHFAKIKRFIPAVKIICGLMLVIVGLLLVFGRFFLL